MVILQILHIHFYRPKDSVWTRQLQAPARGASSILRCGSILRCEALLLPFREDGAKPAEHFSIQKRKGYKECVERTSCIVPWFAAEDEAKWV